jgi:hypothetical protein
MAGYACARVLRAPDTSLVPAEDVDPTVGLQSRVIDSIPEAEVLEFHGLRPGAPAVEQRMRYMRFEGRMRPATIADLSWYIAKKYGAALAVRDTAIRDLIALHNPWETTVLASTRDIPGFSPSQLDPDLRGLSLTRLDVPDASCPDTTMTIIYTWTRVGGTLVRYTFRSHKDRAPYCCSRTVLQEGIGDATYLASCRPAQHPSSGRRRCSERDVISAAPRGNLSFRGMSGLL